VVAKPGPESGREGGIHPVQSDSEIAAAWIEPDRPDVTESPFTVDAGHFQTELSFVEYTLRLRSRSRTTGIRRAVQHSASDCSTSRAGPDAQSLLNIYTRGHVSSSRIWAVIGDTQIPPEGEFLGKRRAGTTAFGSCRTSSKFRLDAYRGLARETSRRIDCPVHVQLRPIDLGTMAGNSTSHRNAANERVRPGFLQPQSRSPGSFTEQTQHPTSNTSASRRFKTGRTYLAYLRQRVLTYAWTKTCSLIWESTSALLAARQYFTLVQRSVLSGSNGRGGADNLTPCKRCRNCRSAPRRAAAAPGSLSLEGMHGTVGGAGHRAGFGRNYGHSCPALLVSVGTWTPGNWGSDLSGRGSIQVRLLWVVALASLMAIFMARWLRAPGRGDGQGAESTIRGP